jgi:hypothetical protein
MDPGQHEINSLLSLIMTLSHVLERLLWLKASQWRMPFLVSCVHGLTRRGKVGFPLSWVTLLKAWIPVFLSRGLLLYPRRPAAQPHNWHNPGSLLIAFGELYTLRP